MATSRPAHGLNTGLNTGARPSEVAGLIGSPVVGPTGLASSEVLSSNPQPSAALGNSAYVPSLVGSSNRAERAEVSPRVPYEVIAMARPGIAPVRAVLPIPSLISAQPTVDLLNRANSMTADQLDEAFDRIVAKMRAFEHYVFGVLSGGVTEIEMNRLWEEAKFHTSIVDAINRARFPSGNSPYDFSFCNMDVRQLRIGTVPFETRLSGLQVLPRPVGLIPIRVSPLSQVGVWVPSASFAGGPVLASMFDMNWTDILKFLKDLLIKICGALSISSGAAASLVQAILDTVGEASVKPIMDLLKDLWKWLKECAWEKAKDCLKAIIQLVKDLLKTAVEQGVKALLKEIGEKAGEMLAKLIAKLTAVASSGGTSFLACLLGEYLLEAIFD